MIDFRSASPCLETLVGSLVSLPYAHAPVSPSKIPILARVLFGREAPGAAEFGVYCLGIIILETLSGKFPSQYPNNAKGGTGVAQLMESAIFDGRETDFLGPEIAGSRTSLRHIMLYSFLVVFRASSHGARRWNTPKSIITTFTSLCTTQFSIL
ncbi:hypothetical protein SADUNF_Sadunf03G0042400 [Salix dunnii]|uniref:Protein kinase domain-containing protein n=1 Tax=Salix dunnii TaxID=1413687 RepID=A0A835KFY7_9ROSI|nr:hypothetical protein SADUNF_Sadunf03G0042400 [Salix dunnii]